jgi:hypothetical protein
MQKIFTVFFTLAIFFCASHVLAANKAKLEKEIKELGQILGYSLICVEDHLGKDMKDPEQQAFINNTFTKFIPLGSRAEIAFREGIYEGIASKGISGGKYCVQFIKAVIAKYESVGLTGDAYKPALDK